VSFALILAPGGCSERRESSFLGTPSIEENTIELLMKAGEFGVARDKVRRAQATNPRDRGFMLDKARLAALTLADGATAASSSNVDELYDLLRQQGVNRDKTVATFLFGEGNTRVWRGEPFEQAMAYYTVGLYDAMTGDWGNVRATSENALFAVRDFSQTLNRGRRESSDVGRETGVDSAATWDAESRALADRKVLIVETKQEKRLPTREAAREASRDFDPKYDVARSDFELGYVLKAIATHQLGETQQRDEALANLRAIAPRLDSLASTIAAGQYNTVLIVEYGIGPEKYGTGPDNAIAMFRPRTRSSEAALVVSASSPAGTSTPLSFPIVTDVNRLALDVRWNNLEDMRLAKSAIGDLLFYGGAITAGVSRKNDQQLAGLGVSLAGLLLKGSAQVDTRHNDALPQRVYVAPLWLEPGTTTLDLQIEGLPQTLLRVPIVRSPSTTEALAVYARLVETPGQWHNTGTIRYANDATGALRDASGQMIPTLPYILGGRCVRTPSPELIFEYRQAGLPVELSIDDVRALYREEGVAIGNEDVSAAIGKHVLEGGSALFTPSAGSTGFARLLGIDRKPYSPKSRAVRDLVERLRANRPASTSPQPPAKNPTTQIPPTQGGSR
jgi:hypothetical protein